MWEWISWLAWFLPILATAASEAQRGQAMRLCGYRIKLLLEQQRARLEQANRMQAMYWNEENAPEGPGEDPYELELHEDGRFMSIP